jgi:hypothetical protein
MPDPISECAEYLVVARGGSTQLYLSQRGRLQDPGTVAVVRVRPRATQALTGWLSWVRQRVGRPAREPAPPSTCRATARVGAARRPPRHLTG